MEEPKDKRTREYKEWRIKQDELNTPSKGFGDTIQKVLESKPIKPLTNLVKGWLFDDPENCNCDERKDIINKLFPYKKNIKWLSEEDFKWVDEYDKRRTNTVNNADQLQICKIHATTFQHKYHVLCTCNGKLFKEWINDIITVKNQMKEEL